MTFKPMKRADAPHRRNIKIEVSPERYAELQAFAKASGVSLKELVRQMVEYAWAHRT